MLVSDQQIVEAYDRLGNVRLVASELKIKTGAVSDALRLAGKRLRWEPLTNADRDRIRKYYETAGDDFDLSVLAAELGRTKHIIARTAGSMGLTNQGRVSAPHRRAIREASKDKWKNREHPRGMLGKKHSPEVVALVAANTKRAWATAKAFGIGNMSPENRDRRSREQSRRMNARPAHTIYTRARGGRRDDLGQTWFRSSWEANYARYLNLLMSLGVVVKWDFEPQTFWFEGVRRGTVSYKPDFRVFYKNDPIPEYVELKGWVVAKDRTKWRRMAKYYPEIKLTIIKAKEYSALARKWSSSILNWESSKARKYDARDDFEKSLSDCYQAVRARKAAGGVGWTGRAVNSVDEDIQEFGRVFDRIPK